MNLSSDWTIRVVWYKKNYRLYLTVDIFLLLLQNYLSIRHLPPQSIEH